MDSNVKFKITALNGVIRAKITERINKNAKSINSESSKDSSFLEKAVDNHLDREMRKENEDMSLAIKQLDDLNMEINQFESLNDGLSEMIVNLQALPKLDEYGYANDAIMNAYKKDFSGMKRSSIEKINNVSASVTRLLGRYSSMNVYYGGSSETNSVIREEYPTRVAEPISTTIEKLSRLYLNKVNSYSSIKMSSEDLHVSTIESDKIERYEQMFNEGKVDIKPRKKVFFIKEDPRVLISNAKKAAVEKARANAALTALETLKVPVNFAHTAAVVDELKRNYQKTMSESQKVLDSFDVEGRTQEVKEVEEQERLEEQVARTKEQLIALGYALAKAKAEGNSELIAQISSEVTMIMYNEKEKEFLLDQGASKYHAEMEVKQAEIDIKREEIEHDNGMEKVAKQALYDQAVRELQMEGAFEEDYVQSGLDVKGTMSNERREQLIHERMQQIEAREMEEQHKYDEMSPEELTVEYLKSIGRIPDNATVEEAARVQDFFIIKNSVVGGREDIISEIQANNEEKRQKQVNAYKMFKISKSQFDALSAVRRQQMVATAEMLKDLDEERIQSNYQFKRVSYDVQNELGELEQVSGGRRL